MTDNASKYVFGDGATTSIGRSVSTLANEDLKWERTRGINIGADFEILGGRLDDNVEYYNSNLNRAIEIFRKFKTKQDWLNYVNKEIEKLKF